MEKKKRIGEWLVDEGLVTEEQVRTALADQKQNGERLGKILIAMGAVAELEVVRCLSLQLRIPYLDLASYLVDPVIARIVPEAIARKHWVLALNKVGNRMTLAMEDPLNIIAIDDIQLMTGLVVKPVICCRQDILKAISELYLPRGEGN